MPPESIEQEIQLRKSEVSRQERALREAWTGFRQSLAPERVLTRVQHWLQGFFRSERAWLIAAGAVLAAWTVFSLFSGSDEDETNPLRPRRPSWLVRVLSHSLRLLALQLLRRFLLRLLDRSERLPGPEDPQTAPHV